MTPSIPTTATESPHAIADEVIEQAAAWLVEISSDDCDAEQYAAFLRWQDADPSHAQAIRSMQVMIDQLEHLQQLQQTQYPTPHIPSAVAESTDSHFAQSEIVEHAIQEQQQLEKKFSYRSALSMFCILGILTVLFSWQFLPVNYWLADQRSHYQQWSEQQLLDQSHIKISGESAYNIHFDPTQRRIELLSGNIMVDVAKDPQRPFTVSTTYADIQALGTRFMVQHSAEQSILTMLESKVVVHSKQTGQTQIIQAGQQVMIDGNGIHAIQAISPALYQQAWQQHRLIVDQMPLSQVLDILQSYQQDKIYYRAADLHGLHVTAILPLDDPQQAYTLLQDSLPIQIRQPLPYIRYVHSIKK
ncbi:FecR family protein [Acinetobacter larvae]|uniref:FecR protein domain-containing protein n=1 Tax=Acinetobacter larvae TaxID=1789224 RepID=A0A1B2LYA4_9GAMM|nr:FecR domain-containing protein [Acinetobacter larvae]AOA57920.1 hypothetical protein BFG52_05850 [Acinetobacter larvae]